MKGEKGEEGEGNELRTDSGVAEKVAVVAAVMMAKEDVMIEGEVVVVGMAAEEEGVMEAVAVVAMAMAMKEGSGSMHSCSLVLSFVMNVRNPCAML